MTMRVGPDRCSIGLVGDVSSRSDLTSGGYAMAGATPPEAAVFTTSNAGDRGSSSQSSQTEAKAARTDAPNATIGPSKSSTPPMSFSVTREAAVSRPDVNKMFAEQRSRDLRADQWELPRVAAGHHKSILKHVSKYATEVPCNPDFVMKVYDEAEAANYLKLQRTKDVLYNFTAKYGGEVDPEDLPECAAGGRYMILSNLMRCVEGDPHVMDCKVGSRSFGEDEASNLKPRKDLFKRLIELDPADTYCTPDEHKNGAVTKYRWMCFNDKLTKMDTLGFRVDGIANSYGSAESKKLKKLAGISEIAACIINDFLPVSSNFPHETILEAPEDGFDSSDEECMTMIASSGNALAQCRLAASESILAELEKMYEAMKSSEFVKTHSFVGCSLLFVGEARGSQAGAYLIDLAKTSALPEGISIDHRSEWKLGNHEDGLFIGMDNMIACWKEVISSLRSVIR